jgi:hypothetical protein
VTARKKKPTKPTVVVVRVGRWTVEVNGPVRWTVTPMRQACGDAMSWDAGTRTLRAPISYAHDVLAALDAAGVPVRVQGELPLPGVIA